MCWIMRKRLNVTHRQVDWKRGMGKLTPGSTWDETRATGSQDDCDTIPKEVPKGDWKRIEIRNPA